MPLAWGIFLPFCARAARSRAGLCGKENLYTNSIIITIGIFCPRGRQCTGPCLMPGGLWAAAAGRLGAAPAAGSGKGGQKWQRRVVPLAVNSAGHWGSTGGRGTALAEGNSAGSRRRHGLRTAQESGTALTEGNSAGSGRRHGPRTAQAIGAAPMGKAAPAAGNKACGAGLAHLRNFWYTGSRTHAAGGTGQSGALRRHTARGRALPLAPAARRRACWRQCIGGAAARTRQRGGKAQ